MHPLLDFKSSKGAKSQVIFSTVWTLRHDFMGQINAKCTRKITTSLKQKVTKKNITDITKNMTKTK